MKKPENPETEINIVRTLVNPMFRDDIEQQILSPLSCLREFGSKWVLEFDLPLVNKKDISVSLDAENTITVEAKLKETYGETNHDYRHKFNYFKKSVLLPGKLNEKKITAKFENGRLTISIPKLFSGYKINIE
ncbi:MAG: Hsp20/alpha crystallin family protein [Nitrosopumilaceae archaeon]